MRAFPQYPTGWITYYTTFLQRATSTSPGANDGTPLQTLNNFGAEIAVQGTPGDVASVKITAGLAEPQIYGPNTCAEGSSGGKQTIEITSAYRRQPDNKRKTTTRPLHPGICRQHRLQNRYVGGVLIREHRLRHAGDTNASGQRQYGRQVALFEEQHLCLGGRQ